jgi:hypothetical protein
MQAWGKISTFGVTEFSRNGQGWAGISWFEIPDVED